MARAHSLPLGRGCLAAVVALLSSAACSLVTSLDDFAPVAPVGDTAPTDGAPLEGGAGGGTDVGLQGDGAACPILIGSVACQAIPRFTARGQTLDGDGNEFCDIPATRFAAATGVEPSIVPPPSSVDAVAAIRVAWGPDALHVHVHVDEAVVHVASPSDLLYNGDSIELYMSGSASDLSGGFTAQNDAGAMHVIAAPPSDTLPGRAVAYDSMQLIRVLDGSVFAARLVPGGYEIELELPWMTPPGPPAGGAKVGFDFGLNQQVIVDGGATRFTSTYAIAMVPSGAPCDGVTFAAYCDDRTWCTPTLQ